MHSHVSTPTDTRQPTGIPGLDDVLHGGLIPHRLYLIDGHPGAGKTTLAIKFLLEGAARGERCLFLTLSETREELIASAGSHGWSLEDLEVVELTASDAELEQDAQITMFHPAEVELNDTTRQILDAVERVNRIPSGTAARLWR